MGLMGHPWGQGAGPIHKKPRHLPVPPGVASGDSEAVPAEPWLVGTEDEL